MHYIFTDLHGDMELWKQILSRYWSEENTLIFLGDACDRDEYGYEIMCSMLALKNFVYLKGNHEDMFVKAAKEISEWRKEERLTVKEVQKMNTYAMAPYGDNYHLHLQNGGGPTIMAWVQAGMPMDFVNKIDALPYYHRWAEYDFCHAGCRVAEWNDNRSTKEFKDSIIWSRDHFDENWIEGRVLVHGHTPTVSRSFIHHMPANFDYAYRPATYANGTKINMDTRSFITSYGWVLCGEDRTFERIMK